MDRRRLSRQELIRARRGDGFVGREGELGAFRANLARDPADPDFRFLHHLHGQGGVGKTSLAQRFEQMAREVGALTVYVDESVHSVPEAMAGISARLGRQGSPLKSFDKLLATYRERRHEAEAALAGPDEPGGEAPPSTGSTVIARAGVAGLGLIPGVGPFAGVVDPTQLARGTDRLRGRIGARLRNHDDVHLVLSPVEVLTPVFVRELGEAADTVPVLALFFDTYEATGPLLDAWLRDILFSDRYGPLAPNIMVTLSGRDALDRRCWADHLEHVTDISLDAFTEAEARRYLAAKDITDPDTVDAILRLSGGLPVLVSTLAGSRPGAADAVDDPSDTAVERFLKWETDPVRREAALAAALPRHLDEDMYREAVDAEAADHFGWLRTLPFVSERGGRWQYHEVVRTAMLRLQRRRSPRVWGERHGRLAEGARRLAEECAGGRDLARCRRDERWRELRLREIYHGLCADPRGFLAEALSEVAGTVEYETTAVRPVAETVWQAGEDGDAPEVRDWGRRLTAALDGPDGLAGVLTELLGGPGLDTAKRVAICRTRGREHRKAERWEQAFADFDRCLEAAPDDADAWFGRGLTHRYLRHFEQAAEDFTRALAIDPDQPAPSFQLGEVNRLMGRHEQALTLFDRVLERFPIHAPAHGSRAVCLRHLGRYEESLSGLRRAVELTPGYSWALAELGMTYAAMGQYTMALAEFDRALAADPEYAWAAAARGRIALLTGRLDDAVANFGLALALGTANPWAPARRAKTHQLLGAEEEALADYATALALADTGRTAMPDVSRAVFLAARAGCLRRARRFGAAWEAVEAARAIAPEELLVRYEAALLASAVHGLPDAASAWEALRAGAQEGPPPSDEEGLTGTAAVAVVAHCALGDWASARAAVADLLGGGTPWERAAEAEYGLRDLAGLWRDPDAPGAGQLADLRRVLLERMAEAAAVQAP
ncbi:tetratricopeptide repeat protein [Streptomyces rimosus]|uniref:tetratricopeptide repeat protein n=1 Tax=Streptomyces rimosus TaxID=1927 RepID=UPI00067CC90F|nr:tetratricopeptide repeat protein [Streptomyces rimosus]